MTLYRPHRGGLHESMALVRDVVDHAQLVRQIRLDRAGWPDQDEVTPESVEVAPYGRDERIGWDTYIVTVNGNAVGFTNGPLARE